MRAHTTVPSLRYSGTGSAVYLEIGFDARPPECPGAQWLTIQKRTDEAGREQEGDLLPRDLMKERVVKIGKVQRQVTVEPDSSFSASRRRLVLSLATRSPYRIVRHTRLEGGGIADEVIFPFPREPEPQRPQKPAATLPDLWTQETLF
jgi:hypothetical protein